MTTIASILQQALQLPEADRASVAHELLLSLHEDSLSVATDHQLAEIVRARQEKLASGDYVGFSLEDAMAQLRASLKEAEES